MLRFFAFDWNQIVRVLESLSNPLNFDMVNAIIEGKRDKLTGPLEQIAISCKKLGLEFSASYAREMIEKVNSSPSLKDEIVSLNVECPSGQKTNFENILNPTEFQREITILRKRIDDELKGREFFALASDRVGYFDKPNLFGESVTVAFPSAIVDIEEAGKCLAFDRGTACVYHLMRVMERGLKATAKVLGIKYAPSWESYLKQIDALVQQKHKRKGVKWKRDEPFFKDAWAHLHSVKAAWRNPTMHVVRDYTPEQAEEILRSVQTFIRHLATRLHE